MLSIFKGKIHWKKKKKSKELPRADPSRKSLPVELMEETLLWAWCTPCHATQPRSILVKLFLVNRAFNSIMSRIVLQHVRLDSGWAVLWYDNVFDRSRERIRAKDAAAAAASVAVSTEDTKGKGKEKSVEGGEDEDEDEDAIIDLRPRELCRDLHMTAKGGPGVYHNMMNSVVKSDFSRVIPTCIHLEYAVLDFGTLGLDSKAVAQALSFAPPSMKRLEIILNSTNTSFNSEVDLTTPALKYVRELWLRVSAPVHVANLIRHCPAVKKVTIEGTGAELEALAEWIPTSPYGARRVDALPQREIQVIMSDEVQGASTIDQALTEAKLKGLIPMLP